MDMIYNQDLSTLSSYQTDAWKFISPFTKATYLIIFYVSF